ncbi:uncharacterized protein F5Z01DRAFT_652072 [Emericellopsis atlantica]|uniref:F-box domain-containing protein n=1 Tax=Emericellopsis atlantica TaxID=2614577 RepID=A0A9P8CSH8_9HYPO|nr:uncharacterized protein F5Z01DRAFT_652072 [Emericellopsis atlantica]KAG9255766.1 hypothetical protein F5Z01DRAFT_652072 [Emericellopsis atlantica]
MASQATLAGLPSELLGGIAAELPTNRDVRNLRLTCKILSEAVLASLKLSRVFLSAHPVNIEVLRAIADHDYFRYKVTELIWDDARFVNRGDDVGFDEDGSELDEDDMEIAEMYADDPDERPHQGQKYPEWFGIALDYNYLWGPGLDRRLSEAKRFSSDSQKLVSQSEAELPPARAWKYYRQLLQQQDEVLQSTPALDEEALKYALARFPNLRRITLTPAAHGFLFMPLYRTPLIRQLPRGLNYPLPRGWPTAPYAEPAPEAPLWQSEHVKNMWRGFRIITRALAQDDSHSVSEFLVDVNYLDSGLTYHVFDDKSHQEYKDLVTVMSRPGFRRLDLSLSAGDAEDGENWTASTHDNLRHALGCAALEHFRLSTNASRARSGIRQQLDSFIPLRQLLPIEAWPRLRHFGIAGIVVDTNELVDVLASLPTTLRTVELSFLLFKEGGGGSYKELLEKIRDKLPWADWEIRPTLILKTHYLPNPYHGKTTWYSKEATRFIYGEQEHLFGQKPHKGFNSVPYGKGLGGVSRDEFDPTWEKPSG